MTPAPPHRRATPRHRLPAPGSALGRGRRRRTRLGLVGGVAGLAMALRPLPASADPVDALDPDAQTLVWRPCFSEGVRRACRRSRHRSMAPPVAEDALGSTYLDITCNDTPWTGDRASLLASSAEQGERCPLVGWSTLAQPCVFRDRPASATLAPRTGQGVPPVLIVQDEHDPATPVEDLLLGVTGAEDSTCQGVGLPEPEPSGAAGPPPVPGPGSTGGPSQRPADAPSPSPLPPTGCSRSIRVTPAACR